MFKRLKSLFQNNTEGIEQAYERGLEDGLKRAVKNQEVNVAAPTVTAPENKPRLSKADLSKAKKLRLKYLKDIEDQVRNFSGGVRGASIVKMSTGEVKLYEVKNKEEALDLIAQARDGKLNIIM